MSTMVTLLGPIKHWWEKDEKGNDLWGNSTDYYVYDRHRTDLAQALVDAGFLVYQPHKAFKGQWDEEKGQPVNDTALLIADVSLVMSVREDWVSDGTDDEIETLDDNGRPWYYCPPGSGNIEEMVAFLKESYPSDDSTS